MIDSRSAAAGSPLVALLRRALAGPADRPAVTDRARTRTIGDLAERVPRLAAALLERAGGTGGRVAVCLANGAAYVEAYLAAFRAGVTLVPLHPQLPADTVRDVVRQVAPAAILFDARGRAVADAAVRASSARLERIEVGGDDDDWERLARDTARLPLADPGPAAAAAIFLTSGTTGSPKGVVVSHANWAAGLRGLESAFGCPAADDVLLHLTPLSHTAGELILPALAAGARQVVLDEGDVEAAARSIARGEGTRLFVFSPLLEPLVEAAVRANVPARRLRSLLYGGAPAPLAVVERALVLFGPVLEQGYGQTETFPPTVALAKADHVAGGPKGRWIRGSIGRPVRTCDVRLLGPAGIEPVPSGAVGEIAVRGANVTAGYYRDEPATHRSRRADFQLTGDLAVQDDDGYLHLMGRRAETFRRAERDVHARAVEREVEAHPLVREAAVCEVAGALVLAVVPRDGAAADLRQVLATLLAERLESHARPTRIELLPALPRNQNLKLRRDALAALLAGGPAAGARVGGGK
jgi:acyl-CoA synthetase (AMP-forming)/AMP-acid ligase II